VTSTEVRPWDLRSVGGGPRGRVVGGVVQELALPSGRLLWEWHSLDHVGVAETAFNVKPGPRFDYFHINSIQVAPDGHLIVNARNTWAAYKIDRRTGRVLWRLGGRRSDFKLGRGARFEWQHDVREHANDVVSVFDNAASPQEEPESRALLLRLDTKRMRASLLHAYTHRPERVLSHFLGNTQLLDNGNVFVGWGGSPYMTEFDRAGGIIFEPGCRMQVRATVPSACRGTAALPTGPQRSSAAARSTRAGTEPRPSPRGSCERTAARAGSCGGQGSRPCYRWR
jgi:Arylsulfotransferase (ASST).